MINIWAEAGRLPMTSRRRQRRLQLQQKTLLPVPEYKKTGRIDEGARMPVCRRINSLIDSGERRIREARARSS